MPKMKTHKATAKRYKVTANGKVMKIRTGQSHLRRKKPKRTRRKYKQAETVEDKALQKKVRRSAPYLWKK